MSNDKPKLSQLQEAEYVAILKRRSARSVRLAFRLQSKLTAPQTPFIGIWENCFPKNNWKKAMAVEW